MNWYIDVLKKYAVFSGRARRKEYWMFILISTIITLVLSVIEVAASLNDPATGPGLISGLYSLAVFIPSIAVLVRRLHDTDRTGWLLLLLLVPLIGAIVLIVFLATDSSAGDNQYGPNPKGA
ncbi:MAG: DUF805 domain-containing protein [Chromatiales bacterium]|mgnify:CR=1 FL=1|jgi:uncharacterized membrane protein YhaH (DUF805 family)|nr:DUF805 domain-containing protein [Chromatiales bacterium]